MAFTALLSLPALRERLQAVQPYWSEIAHLAGLSLFTVEGIASGRPRQQNPRYETLVSIHTALEQIEARLHHP